jgi:hypothetical protein
MKPLRSGLLSVGMLLGMSASFGQSPSLTGQLQGSVTTSSGKPVAGAKIAIRVRPSMIGESFQVFNADTTTASDGTFSVSAVPKGKYAICAYTTGMNLLDICAWESEPTVTVAGGQAVVAPAIVLKPSVDLVVQVNDPSGLIVPQGTTPTGQLRIAIRSPLGAIVPVPLASSTGTQVNYRLAVPPDTDLDLIVFSHGFNLSTQAGTAVPNDTAAVQQINIPASAGQGLQSFTVTP